MSLCQRVVLLACVVLAGCNSPTITPPLAQLTTSQATTSVDSKRSNPPTAEQPQPPAETKPRYTVNKAITPATGPEIPPVLLSAGHAKLCRVRAGEQFPDLSLTQLGGQPTKLATLRGQQATVILFWHPDRWMARTALSDMQRDIASQFQPKQVAVLGIAVRQPQGAAQAALNTAEASFPQFLDTDGQAFATVGTAALPRLYVLDPNGRIAWFDIEYSEGTRRELWQTLNVLTQASK